MWAIFAGTRKIPFYSRAKRDKQTHAQRTNLLVLNFANCFRERVARVYLCSTQSRCAAGVFRFCQRGIPRRLWRIKCTQAPCPLNHSYIVARLVIDSMVDEMCVKNVGVEMYRYKCITSGINFSLGCGIWRRLLLEQRNIRALEGLKYLRGG